MLSGFKPRLTYANVMVTLLTFIVLGGGAYATIDRKIGPKDIRKNAVKAKQLAPSSVKPQHIRQGAVKTNKIPDGAITATKLADGVAISGPQGEQGPQGVPGEDATKLFGYIRDAGTAVVHYGSGVTGVTDPPGNNAYLVRFNRSVENCVAQAEAGFGDPAGIASAIESLSSVSMSSGDDDQVRVRFLTHEGTVTDTSFLITAFC
jgi:hypothetical protein